MNNSEQCLKEFKIGMELKELNSDRERLLHLCNFGNVYEINSYIDNIAMKYPLETNIYHTTHSMPSTNLQERVQSCMNFLDELIQAKKVELTLKATRG